MPPNRISLADRLSRHMRKRAIGVGPVPQVIREEVVSRNLSECLQNTRIADAPILQLARHHLFALKSIEWAHFKLNRVGCNRVLRRAKSSAIFRRSLRLSCGRTALYSPSKARAASAVTAPNSFFLSS